LQGDNQPVGQRKIQISLFQWLENQKFNLFFFEISANVKIAVQTFENFFGEMPKYPPDCAPALFDTVVKSLNYIMLSATTRMN